MTGERVMPQQEGVREVSEQQCGVPWSVLNWLGLLLNEQISEVP